MGPLAETVAEMLAGDGLPTRGLRRPASPADGAAALALLRDAGEAHAAVWLLRAEALLATGDPVGAMAALQTHQGLGGRDASARLSPYLTGQRGGPLAFNVHGSDVLAPATLLVTLVGHLPSVVRMQAPGAAKGLGSGFVVDGAQLHDTLSGELLVITNAHVCSVDPKDQARRARPPSELVAAQFDAHHALVAEHAVAEIVWHSPFDELDASVLRLKTRIDAQPLPLSQREIFPGTTRALPIGFADGGDRVFPMPPHPVADVQGAKVTYRSATRGGMSGSPVFDTQAEVIVLHHAGGAEVNRGIWIGAIQYQLRRTLS